MARSKAMQVNDAAQAAGVQGRDVRMSRMLPGMGNMAAALNANQNLTNQNLNRQTSPAPVRP